MKFIIDTGATHSIINPGICHPKWFIHCEETNLKTLQHNIKLNEKVAIPIFEEFVENSENKIEFLVCHFHDHYDGLIGNDILKQLKAIINLKENILDINGKHIPINYAIDSNEYYFEKDGFYAITLAVEHQNGLVYSPQHFCENKNVEIIENIHDAENFKINALIKVNGNTPRTIKFDTPKTVKVTNENFCVYNIQEEVLKIPILEQIRTNHLNSEEKDKLLQIINRFKKYSIQRILI